MGWTDEDLSRSRHELLDKVVRRGDQLRNRRRLALMAALPVLLLAVLLPSALRGGDDAGTTVAASSPTATGPAPTLLVSPSTAAEVPTTTSMVPLTIVPDVAPTTTLPRSTATTVRPTSPQSIVPPPPTTVPDPEPTTTIPPTTIPPNQPPGTFCNPPKMTATATTDKQSYRVGEVVRATATWSNTSGETCWYKHGYWGNWVVDSTGKIVTPQAWPPFDHGEWRAFAPGETQSHSWTWDLTVCTFNNTTVCTPAPPGTYKIIFDYEPFAEPTVTLQVVAS